MTGRSAKNDEQMARLLWASATTFADLCELSAQYVGGELAFSPSQGGAIDEETSEIALPVAALNRAGLLTSCSQPALMDGDVAQRAFVDGLAPESTALEFATRSLYADILIFVVPPLYERGYMVPVTRTDGHPHTWIGHCNPEMRAHELEQYRAVCHPSAVSELEAAWYVAAIDLSWGRKEHLWRLLLEAPRSGYTARPDPDLGIDHEFYF